MNKGKKAAVVKPFMVRNYLSVFINCMIENPAFDSQVPPHAHPCVRPGCQTQPAAGILGACLLCILHLWLQSAEERGMQLSFACLIRGWPYTDRFLAETCQLARRRRRR